MQAACRLCLYPEGHLQGPTSPSHRRWRCDEGLVLSSLAGITHFIAALYCRSRCPVWGRQGVTAAGSGIDRKRGDGRGRLFRAGAPDSVLLGSDFTL